MSFVMPHQIDVGGFPGSGPEPTHRIQPSTALFRMYSDIGRLLHLAAAVAPNDPLEAICGGCSIGAEPDTLFGMSHLNLPGRPVHILGIDEDAYNLGQAAAGRYRLLNRLDYLRDAYASEEVDFDEHIGRHGMRALASNDGERGMIDTSGLRARYQVDFCQADMADEVPASRPAHLVTCQNVAFHHEPAAATAIATNLARNVAVGGLFSLGLVTNNSLEMGPSGETLYIDWQAELASVLGGMGFVPAGQPADELSAFRRVA